MGESARFERGFDVRKVQIDQRGIDNELRNAADTLSAHFVRHFQSVGEGRSFGNDFADFVVGNDDDGVHRFSQFLHAARGIVHPALCLEGERKGHDRHGEDFHILGNFRDDGRGARSRSAAHARRDEQKVGIFQSVLNDVLILFRRGFSHRGIRTRTQTFGELHADLNPVACLGTRKRLIVRIHNDIFRTFQSRFDETIDGVVSRSADADHLDLGNAGKIIGRFRSRRRRFPVGPRAVSCAVIIVSEIVEHYFFPPKMLKILLKNPLLVRSPKAVASTAILDEKTGLS